MKRIEFRNSNANVEMEYDESKDELRVIRGVLRAFGWVWYYGNENPGLLIVRMFNSTLWKEFADAFDQSGIPWRKLAELIVNDGESLYGLTGDNRAWYFGELIHDVEDHVLAFFEECDYYKNGRKLSHFDINELNFEWIPGYDYDELFDEFAEKTWKDVKVPEIEGREDFEDWLSDLGEEMNEAVLDFLFDRISADYLSYLEDNGIEISCP